MRGEKGQGGQSHISTHKIGNTITPHKHTHTSGVRGAHRCEGLYVPRQNKQEVRRDTHYIREETDVPHY